ncbi:phosphatidylinositol 3-kinase catalytic subunit type [Anaeramoeba flamelloides]|uniref:phosphatidylinositol 3-kinase n=1 Tax=Anaeramoeba flamelloides TaxID=1746091 RepID=A0AAV7Z966_9EUKA|nr:phosphatidylinositol 3-kinase catalytic subunit type [Anaeramoeba flamelloides]
MSLTQKQKFKNNLTYFQDLENGPTELPKHEFREQQLELCKTQMEQLTNTSPQTKFYSIQQQIIRTPKQNTRLQKKIISKRIQKHEKGSRSVPQKRKKPRQKKPFKEKGSELKQSEKQSKKNGNKKKKQKRPRSYSIDKYSSFKKSKSYSNINQNILFQRNLWSSRDTLFLGSNAKTKTKTKTNKKRKRKKKIFSKVETSNIKLEQSRKVIKEQFSKQLIPEKNYEREKEKEKEKENEKGKENETEDPYRKRGVNLIAQQVMKVPSEKEMEKIQEIIRYPSIFEMTDREKNLIWYWRIYLSKSKWKGALPCFIRSIDFNNEQEITEMKKLISKFDELGVVSSLELLSKSYQNPFVREMAVNRLKKCEDDELQLYLLQIVQGLRYEKDENSPLSTFLIQRASKNPILGNFFYWYVGNERKDKDFPIFARVHLQYARVLLGNEMGKLCLKVLHRQEDLINNLKQLANEATNYSKNRKKNKLYLSWLLENDQKYSNLKNFEKDIPLPLNPLKVVVGIDPKSVIIFKSALNPIKIDFITNLNEKVPIIFKRGDDLRQDQLALQLFTIMDNLLKKENMDLQFTIYDVISNSPEEGMVEFVQAKSLASVLKENNGKLAEYFKKTNPDNSTEYGFSSSVMESYVRSCAGYSVITYLLGVGDRHLDNLMVSPNGRLLHIDFGYILGHDPKPFPPPMKLCKEMIVAMGGMKSKQYLYLKKLCGEAYIILRKHSRLIINLLTLMIDANIPDIAIDPKNSITKMQERFRLDLNKNQAIEFIEKKIDESVGALFAVVIEKLHSWAQYWRS